MNIDDQSLLYIMNVIKAADAVKIGNIAVEAGCIRAMDENQTVFILHTEGVPQFEFGSIGLNRLPEFVARINIAKGINAPKTITATVEANGGSPFARALQIKSKGLKVDYRCANPMTIMAPRSLKAPFVFQFDVEDSIASFLLQGQSAYKAETVTFIGTDEGVTMKLIDINNDAMEYEVSNHVEILECDNSPDKVEFTFKYPIKHLLALLKGNVDAKLAINSQGILRIRANGFDVHIWAVQ